MRAWVGSFGKPLLCVIEADGKLAGYRFENDKSPAIQVTACELFRGGRLLAFDDGET
jgi:hypothetical protein